MNQLPQLFVDHICSESNYYAKMLSMGETELLAKAQIFWEKGTGYNFQVGDIVVKVCSEILNLAIVVITSIDVSPCIPFIPPRLCCDYRLYIAFTHAGPGHYDATKVIGSVSAVEEEPSARPSTPRWAKNKRKLTKKAKKESVEKLEEELLSGLFCNERHYGHDSELQDVSEDSCDGEDFIDCYPPDYPCQLDFYHFKHRKIVRKRETKHVSIISTERKKSNACNLHKRIKMKDAGPEGNKQMPIYIYNIKKNKQNKIYLVKREAKKAAKRIRDRELKAKNVELRLKLNQTPRRGPNVLKRIDSGFASATSRSHGSNHHHHILTTDNSEKFKSEVLLCQLIGIQEREITPEDFELLLRLDTFVDIKTVPKCVIDNLKTELVTKKFDSPCMICMEEYEFGQLIMHLKCHHIFHSNCIRTWLTVNSTKCPLDGLPVS